MPRITSILFDMDGVLCDYDFDGRLKALEAAIGIPAAEIDAKIFKSGFEDAADLGQYGAPGYMEEVARLLDADVDAGTWLAARADAAPPRTPPITTELGLKSSENTFARWSPLEPATTSPRSEPHTNTSPPAITSEFWSTSPRTCARGKRGVRRAAARG